MKIYEVKFDNNMSRIEICEHKAVVKTFTLMYSSESDKYNQICNFIEELDQNRNSHFFGKQKELIKAFGEIDERYKELYKELYPHGGWRKGGRPKGSKTEKTERLNLAVTPDEKAAVLDFLDNYRKFGKLESIKEELAPYLKQIDDGFGNDEAAREKWRKRMLNVNPALYPYMLEHFKIFGIEESIAAARKQYIKPTIEKPVKKVSDEYINAVQEIQKEQEKSRPKLRTLDEAFKEYQDRHKK